MSDEIKEKTNPLEESKGKDESESKFKGNDTLIENPDKLGVPPSIVQIHSGNKNFVKKIESQNSISSKKQSTNNMKKMLLKEITSEGKPKQFFGNQPQHKKSEELKSISTSNFQAKFND